jgi:hypothetical protein
VKVWKGEGAGRDDRTYAKSFRKCRRVQSIASKNRQPKAITHRRCAVDGYPLRVERGDGGEVMWWW